MHDANQNLPWVHDAMGSKKPFDLFHQGEAFPMLFLHKLLFSNPNTMLPLYQRGESLPL